MGDNSSMAPWDVQKYFDTPTESVFNITVLATPIAKSNPNRIGLIFSSAATGGITLSTDPQQTAGKGMVVNASFPVLILTQSELGPLINQAWFAGPLGAAALITVIEIVVNKWPEGK